MTFIFVLTVAAASSELLTPRTVHAVEFTVGPSVRVSPNDKVEFKWSADVAWRAYVEVFDNPDAPVS